MASKEFVCLDDFEAVRQTKMMALSADYYATGADEEATLWESKLALKRYRIRPRILRDVSVRRLATTIQGHPISFPICISPTALQRCAHVEAEKATAKAAEQCGTLMILSMISSTTIADVANAAPSGLHWMNIYLMKNREVNKHMIREAERCGYRGIVLTVDSPKLGNHIRTARSRFNYPQDSLYKAVNFDIPHIPETQESKVNDPLFWSYFPPRILSSATILDVKWLKSFTKLPVICKGVLSGEAAVELAEAGVDGILVSAHGGRQLDYVPAPIDALGEVVEAVRGYPVEVYMDGGVRTGTDVFKALARGARAVFIGRPILWGLACNGEKGVKQVLDILKEEFSLAMALAGCSKLSDIEPSMVVHESYYNSKL